MGLMRDKPSRRQFLIGSILGFGVGLGLSRGVSELGLFQGEAGVEDLSERFVFHSGLWLSDIEYADYKDRRPF